MQNQTVLSTNSQTSGNAKHLQQFLSSLKLPKFICKGGD
jgi:hypothetical protein